MTDTTGKRGQPGKPLDGEEPNWSRSLNQYVDSDGFMALFLTALTVLYLLAYLGHPALPGNSPTAPQGWWGYWDQGHYLKSTAALAGGQLTPDTYRYPLGYPLIGSLFYRWAPQHAFLIPNLVFVLGSTVLFYRISCRLVSPLEAILLMLTFIGSYLTLLSTTMVVPWNTIPTHFLSYLVIFLVGFCQPSAKRVLLAFTCVGLIFLCRPADALCMMVLPGLAILPLPHWGTRVRVAAAGACIVGVFILTVLFVNQAVFGSWRTTYDTAQAQMGVGSYSLGYKLFGLLIDGNTLFREPQAAMLRHFPWALLVLPGIVYLLLRYRTQALGVILSVVATYALYFLFNDFWPSTIFRFGGIHYLLWTLPLIALICYLGVKEAWRYRIGRWSYLTVPLLLFPVFFVYLRERTIGTLPAELPVLIGGSLTPAKPVDWIFFDGVYACPELTAAGKRLIRKRDFEDSIRPDGTVVLLSTKLRSSSIQVEPGSLVGLRGIQYGYLHWTVRWKRP